MPSITTRLSQTEPIHLGAFMSNLMNECLQEWHKTDALLQVSIQVTQLNKSEWVVRVTQDNQPGRVFRIEMVEVLTYALEDSGEREA